MQPIVTDDPVAVSVQMPVSHVAALCKKRQNRSRSCSGWKFVDPGHTVLDGGSDLPTASGGVVGANVAHCKI